MSKNFELLRDAGKIDCFGSALNAKPADHARENDNGACVNSPLPYRLPFAQLRPDGHLRLLEVLRKNWRWSAGFAMAVIVSVTAVVFLMKAVYVPIAKVEVDPPGAELFTLKGTDAHFDPDEYMQTQAQGLKSDRVAIAVIRKLHLDQIPGFLGTSSTVRSSKPAADEGENGQQELTAAEKSALKIFRRSTDVQRDTSSWLINVGFAARDPKLAALIANTIVEQFSEMEYKTRHEAVAQSTQWLSRQLDDILLRMQASNRALSEFQQRSGITPATGGQSSFDERMAELNRQLTIAQADRIQLEALLAKVNGNAEAIPQLKSDPVVQELSKKLAAARVDLNQALVVYGKNHPKVKELQTQVDNLTAQLAAQHETALANLKTSYATAHMRENLLNSEMKSATGQLSQVAQYQALKKQAEVNADLYNSLYGKVKEAGIAAEAKTANIRLIDPAPVLDSPTRPKRLLAILAAILAGLIGGVLLAFVRESFDTKIHTIQDIRRSTGMSSIALVPLAKPDEYSERTRGWLTGRNGSDDSSEVILLDRPRSPEAEALRGLYTSVRHSRLARHSQILLVASALAGEGKTTIAVNLAISMARHGKTCVVDADLRKANIARLLGMTTPLRGLANVLDGTSMLDQTLVQVDGIPNLTLLPGGLLEGEAGELITKDEMGSVLRQLRKQFQFIIVDSSPILPYAEARAIAPLTDGVILVGRSGVTTREALLRSLELLEGINSAPVLEVVLNGVRYNSNQYRYHYTA